MADTYLSPEDFRAFVASLPRRRLAAGALITDPDGSVLVAKPNYKDGWTLPGGTVEAGEAPQEGCFREVVEETGLHLEPDRLLLIFHGLAMGEWGDSAYFLYDGGTIPADEPIRLQAEELLEYRFVPAAELDAYVGPGFAGRLRRALEARETGEVVELSSTSWG
ncbi:NUDIX hydrolase [Rothia kristinae]|uniref:NUDIX hydrolase n=1 Tax=Rothia kristinae TaxID=37923 RepID=A0A1S2MZD6_9MICC|nr:NUDIX hydrolase [Rothia kristinae]OIJ35718.1 NUDIX hydrolase [Rothia kristinae]